MNTPLKHLLIVFGLLFGSANSLAHAATYYVSPIGNNANPGTISQPFATLQRAHDVANPGDTIYMRGGTYRVPVQTLISRSGSSGNRIKVFNYPGEVPIMDASSSTGSIIRVSTGNWWHFKGLELKNAADFGFRIDGTVSNHIIEFCNIHHNLRRAGSGGGINISRGSQNNILLLNNDVHHNGQIGSEGGDGIGFGSQGTGNIIRGNRMWRNNDDGLDLWGSQNVLVEGNWAWENGLDDSLDPTGGDGHGLKLGGGVGGEGFHTVQNNITWNNFANGIYHNFATNPLTVYNNTSYNNGGTNFSFGNNTQVHVLRNNLAVTPNSASVSASVDDTFNSWNLAVTVSSSDFASLDSSGAAGPRNVDGSLPTIDFLRLVSSSDLIDRGINVGIPFTGLAPDLGAFDYGNSVGQLQAPTNLRISVP